MHYSVCVDDTDMPGTKGTGWLLDTICQALEKERIGTCSAISRHQLFVHEDIPFTSHNSAMCVDIWLFPGQTCSGLIDFMAAALEKGAVNGSDPGLCVAGALAGIGLRLSGNDGRYRGWYHLGRPGDLIRVGDLCAHSFIDKVVTKKGQILHPDTMVQVGSEKTKTVRLGFSRVVVVTENENRSDGNSLFCIITKQEAKHY